MTHVSWPIGSEVAKTDVGRVLSVYIMALTPAIKIASRPTQPAAFWHRYHKQLVWPNKTSPSKTLAVKWISGLEIAAQANNSHEHSKK